MTIRDSNEEREKNKNKKFHWKINVNEINDNNIAYDGDRPMFVFFRPEMCSFCMFAMASTLVLHTLANGTE